MNPRTPLTAVLAMAVAGAMLFVFFHRQVAVVAFDIYPEITASLKQYREDLRQLRRLDPASQALYRQHFDAAQSLLERLEILQINRQGMQRFYERLLLAIFGGTLLVVTGAYAARHGRFERRLDRLREALTQLVEGKTDIDVGERGRDAIGRISSMIETTSRVMAKDRRRLAALKNLSTWQEAARRHAHEMRTPLTGARLELGRLQEDLSTVDDERSREMGRAVTSAMQEIDRLAEFTRHFTSFARLPEPRLVRQNLAELTGEYIQTYAEAWPNLSLQGPELRPGNPPGEESIAVEVDRDMLRQVLVNLCDNSSLALESSNQEHKTGAVLFRIAKEGGKTTLDVLDDGPGVDPAVRDRLFEPYCTTRGIGEGMGLGLAISKKIQLDHGGDLELIEGVRGGAGFRLTFPSFP